MNNVAIEIPEIKAMAGLKLIGDWSNNIIAFCTEIHDENLRCGLHLSEYKSVAKFQEQIYTPEMDSFLEQVKSKIMGLVNSAIRIETYRDEVRQQRQDKYEKKDREIKTRESFNSMHKPAPEGTVDEIAKQFNVSKSEVRRLKREGRLAELTNPASA